MRGISFQINGCGHKNILRTILSEIEIEKLWWHISEDEIYNEMDESLLENRYINGETFLKIIKEKSYSVIFANIKAYPPNSTPNDIENYDDFIKSECKLVILCSDVFYYEIYAKNDWMIEIIKNNAIKNNFSNIEYITNENDCRTGFSVI
ncbi:DUF2691 family protein [Clostridium guangxiense]|uniref:DUF2691 family protein n=1 Tax=Clostridium guangxiense TaxID=1662055 RepID=UPI001E325541|nr:DUF2691 family protein [Clostridium guangxiense]MCD2349064.1 DUF2691 family protein [Clostridium guangxiense]